jgi:hypothetical protein
VVAGQKVKLFFNQLVRADLGEPDIARWPCRWRIVATDIGSGERVVFRSGPPDAGHARQHVGAGPDGAGRHRRPAAGRRRPGRQPARWPRCATCASPTW